MKTSLNLIPLATRRRQLIKRTFSQWTVVCGITLLVISAVVWWAWNEAEEQRVFLDAVHRQYAPLKKLELESNKLRRETESLERRERLALELSRNRSMLTLIGQLSFAASECNGKVNVNQLVFETDERSENDSEDEVYSESKLTLQGVGIDDVAIAQFVAALRDSELFLDVQLTSTGSTVVGEKESKLYTVECVF